MIQKNKENVLLLHLKIKIISIAIRYDIKKTIVLLICLRIIRLAMGQKIEIA